MNKYQEAFYRLTDWFHSYIDNNGVKVQERHITKEYEEAKQTIKELVNKATPKKPIVLRSPSDYIAFECPNCHHTTHSNFRRLYCGECGQKIDWGEDDDR
jgi:transposase